jgi:uncharacterized protein YkwD
MTHASRTKLVLFAALAGAAALTLGLMARSGVTPANAGSGCANANAAPNEASAKQFKAAIICLVNSERSDRGKSRLDVNSKLNKVAKNHTKVMLNQDCFDHECSGEKSLTKRLKSIGYLKGDSWAYAENIGYEHTPRNMVNAWMGDSYHRGNILANRWVDVGGAALKGTPNPTKPDSYFMTYTVEFGDGG